ncbi:Ankyrin repeat domain-containing protein 49 [Caligus rogercresseyi]|uniref:Ankyrin repeat domain-containing protein 49 n=1 Tax=Caligus rogercresseyi TaxID=217165 RepID=A0A7T8HIA4_CALRO|nr:Ankyrin repeat domain-containing protein 49 [Caligus rogercresseyi]|eukprot:TRINITY_DN25040_c0_g1_i1.p1 TRINITY_DN25040_c0_g1~~TRINITY_DN25040_c0_g1_i1.p1  ORF type:complete len:245 (-),score=80.33 TRINITY_DN25040_c0_g1_i1:1082-1816(-)
MSSRVNMSVPWKEGSKADFEDLKAAGREGRLTKDEAGYSSSSEDSEVDLNAAPEGPNPFDSSEGVEEKDEEIPEGPRERFLWHAQRGHLSEVQSLLAEDPGLISFKDEDGYTGLHRSAYTNHPELAKFLLLQGADLSAVTLDGWTPLHSACRWNAFGCVELFLSWGADPSLSTPGGQTPLHLAATHGESKESLELLLLLRPKLNTQLTNGQGDNAKDIAFRKSVDVHRALHVFGCKAMFDLSDD